MERRDQSPAKSNRYQAFRGSTSSIGSRGPKSSNLLEPFLTFGTSGTFGTFLNVEKFEIPVLHPPVFLHCIQLEYPACLFYGLSRNKRRKKIQTGYKQA